MTHKYRAKEAVTITGPVALSKEQLRRRAYCAQESENAKGYYTSSTGSFQFKAGEIISLLEEAPKFLRSKLENPDQKDEPAGKKGKEKGSPGKE